MASVDDNGFCSCLLVIQDPLALLTSLHYTPIYNGNGFMSEPKWPFYQVLLDQKCFLDETVL